MDSFFSAELDKFKKYILLILLVVFLGVGVLIYQFFSFDPEIEKVSLPEDYQAENYYFYLPENGNDSPADAQALLLQPFIGGDEENSAAAEAEQNARALSGLADDLDAVLLVITFDIAQLAEEGGLTEKEAAHWQEPGLIYQDLQERLADRDYQLADNLYLFGFGSSALYASRWLALQAESGELPEAAALGAPGGWPMVPAASYQDRELDFPLGLADLSAEALAESREKLENLPLLLFGGAEDEFCLRDDSRYFQADHQEILAEFAVCQPGLAAPVVELYQEHLPLVEIKEYQDVDHRLNLEMYDDLLEFFTGITG